MNQNELEHYGVLGMKWGVRRTPEQLGHKTKDPIAKYKQKKLAAVDKMYNKAYKEVDKAESYNPGDKDIAKYRAELKKLHETDRERIESMSYSEVQAARKAESDARKQKAANIAKGTAKAAAGATLFTLKTSLLGVRIYGTLKLATILGEAGMMAVDYLQTAEGLKALTDAGTVARSFVALGDNWIENAASSTTNVALKDALTSIPTGSLKEYLKT